MQIVHAGRLGAEVGLSAGRWARASAAGSVRGSREVGLASLLSGELVRCWPGTTSLSALFT
jgi:hypothetical protein